MTRTLPDGTIIEYTVADSYGGPDNCFSRQNVNTNATFWRLPQTTWVISNHRTMHRFLEWLECCADLNDFLQSEAEAGIR